MRYLKMECGILEPVLRTIFFNPDDTYEINYLVKSDDIKKVVNRHIPSGTCIITPDIDLDLRFQFGWEPNDIIKNEFTCIATQYFI